MTENGGPLATPEPQRAIDGSESERYIVDSLSLSGFPPADFDLDLQDAEHALRGEDWLALESLGSSQDLVARIASSDPHRRCAHPEAQRPTVAVASSLDDTVVAAASPRSRLAEGLVELQLQLADNAVPGSLSWHCDYRIKKMIGRGGQGTVHLLESVEEPDLPKALKIFSPEPYDNASSYYEDMNRMKRVASELYKMQVDNLVIVEKIQYRHDIFEMIMRWIDGYDLATLLRPRLLEQVHGCVNEERWRHLTDVVVTTPGTPQLRLQPGMAANIIDKVLRALDALHSHGIVHGDVKPANIMLDRYGSIRLVDIGSAFDLSAPPRQYISTPRYAPPEVFQGRAWTPQGDLASLGYVLIELLSGRPVFSGPESELHTTRVCGTGWRRALLEEKQRLPQRLDELLPANVRESEQLMEICRKLIDPDPRQRFSCAEDALAGPTSTHQFQQTLARMSLAGPYSLEIKRWLTDVMNIS